jgi:hypothetical protein
VARRAVNGQRAINLFHALAHRPEPQVAGEVGILIKTFAIIANF